MGIFSRLGTLIRSNINDLITKAEDPEKMLSQVLLEMQQQLVEAKKAVAIAIADEKKLQKQYTSETDKAKEWERKAMVAVRAGDDNLARQALHSVIIPTKLTSLDHEISMPPREILNLFAKSNPSFPPDSFTLTCRNNYLTAIEVCLTKQLQPTSCGPIRSCRANTVRIPPPQ